MPTHAAILEQLGLNKGRALSVMQQAHRAAAHGSGIELAPGVKVGFVGDNPRALELTVFDKQTKPMHLIFEEGKPTRMVKGIEQRSGYHRLDPDAKTVAAVMGYAANQVTTQPQHAEGNFTNGQLLGRVVKALTGESVNWSDSRPGRSLGQKDGQMHWERVLDNALITHSTPTKPETPKLGGIPVAAKAKAGLRPGM